MKGRRIAAAVVVGLGLVAAAAAVRSGEEDGGPDGRGQGGDAVAMPPPGASAVRITLSPEGVARSALGGSIATTAGTVLSVAAESAGVTVEGTRWAVSEAQAPATAKAKAKAKAAAIEPVVLVATLDAPPEATVTVEAAGARLDAVLGQMGFETPVVQVGGPIALQRRPLAVQLTRSEADDDFPVAVRGPDGTVWCAFVSYEHGPPIDTDAVFAGRFDTLEPEGNGDRIRLIRFDGDRWSAPLDVTGPGIDAWRPAAAVDAEGGVWVLWSQREGTDWDLMARRYDPESGSFGDPVVVAGDEGADINAVAASGGPGGGAWVAWQGWRDGRFDVWLASIGPGGPGEAVRVSSSTANDWSPAIAADRDGVWVAWDTYDRGNYDVFIRRFDADGRPDGGPVAVAASLRFEARPSVALDARGRAWVAFEDAGPDWGKDFGTRFPAPQGDPLYLERNVLVRVVEPGGGPVLRVAQPPPSVPVFTHYDDTRVQPTFNRRMSLPRMLLDGRGHPWLLYRRHPEPQTVRGERWASFVTRYEGDAWAPEFALPGSVNLLDNRPSLLPTADGGFLAVSSSDGRTVGSPSAQVNDLFASRVELDRPAAEPVLAAVDPSGAGLDAAALHPDESEEVARMRAYRVEVGGASYRLLRGEFHRHTELSAHRDWDGQLEDMWRYGLDAAAMDWIGPGDHDYAVGLEYMWWLTQKQVDLYHHAPAFVPMFTYERSLPYPSGHRNVMFARRGVRPLPQMQGEELRFGTPEAGAPDIRNLYAFLREFDGICSSHTSATGMGTDWRDGDAEVEPVVEIFQGHRQSYEEPRGPLAATGPDDSIQGYQPAGFVWNAFARGRRLGFQSSSDHVSTHVSYAVVLAEEPTRDAILDAFRRRHCYAANDNIVLDVRSGDHVMGDEWQSAEVPLLDVRVIGTGPIARVDVVRQLDAEPPAYVFSVEGPVPDRRDGVPASGRAEVSLRWTDEDARPGRTHMYYVRIQQADGRLAWASPMWIDYRGDGRSSDQHR